MFHHLDCGIELQVSREGDLDQVQIEVFQVCISIQREGGRRPEKAGTMVEVE